MRKFLAISLIFSFLFAGLGYPQPPRLSGETDQVYRFNIFQGLNTKISNRDLPPEFSTRLENTRFTTIGSLEKRKLFSKYNSTSLGTDPIPWGTRFYFDDSGTASKKLVIAYSTTLRSGSDTEGTFSNIKTGLTSGEKFSSVTYKDHLYMCNGKDNCQRWSGSGNTKDMGLAVPGSGTTAASGGSGNLANGDYNYKITFLYDGYQESEGQATATAFTVSGGAKNVDLSSIPTGATDQGVTKRRVYRTFAGGSNYYRVATISDNTTTTYTDTTADGSLDTTVVIPTVHETVPKFEYITVHNERIFGVKENSSDLYFSRIEEGLSLPDAFDTTNDVISISPDDGDIITGIEEDPSGTLLVFKQNSIRKLYTGTAPPEEWEVSDVIDVNGCIAPYTIKKVPGGVIYLSRQGIAKRSLRFFNGQSSQNISERIEPTLSEISRSLIKDVVAEYHGGLYRLAYPDKATGATENNRVLILDVERDSYAIDFKDTAWFIPWDGAGDIGQLYSTDSGDGFVYFEDTENANLYIKLLSQVSGGVFNQTETTGAEAAPVIRLKASDLTDDVGAQTWTQLSNSTNTWTNYSGELDTWFPSGTWTSPIYEINAVTLVTLNWTENKNGNQEVYFWIRTGDSSTALQANAYSGPYSTSAGSDISAVTARQFIQIKVQLYTNNTSGSPFLYRSTNSDPNDYMIFINAGLGTAAESTINFIWETGDYDYGYPTNRKRFRSLKTRYESSATGTFTINYSLDEGSESSFTVDISSDDTSSVKYFPIASSIGNTLQMRVDENTANAFEMKEIAVVFSAQPQEF